MNGFPGQLSDASLDGTIDSVFIVSPYYLKPLFTVYNRMYAIFGANTQ